MWSVAVHCTRRPARRPPACRLVRPAKTIITSRLKFSATLAWPTRRPSPAATMSVIDTMPQAMPNMVSSVRSLCANSVRIVSRRRSLQIMSVSRRYWRTTLSPSFSPSTTSVLTPFEMPSFTATFLLPPSAFGSGTSSEGLRSLS